MQKALITGASSGIGYELSKIMAANGHDLVLVSRDIKSLSAVRNELEETYKVSVTVEATDLSMPGSAESLHKKLKHHDIEILVNNAGVGLKGNFFDDDLTQNQSMAYLNMNSLMDMTYYFGKDMVKNNRGKILNIASIVAFFPGPKQPVYYATKAFVRSFSRALAYNLRNTNVSVTTLHPGVTKTNFFKTAHAGSFKGGASARDVAALGYRAMMSGKIEVTHGIWNKFLTNIFVRFTPYRTQPMIVDKVSEV
jgi:short-subunit dehydrogenase